MNACCSEWTPDTGCSHWGPIRSEADPHNISRMTDQEAEAHYRTYGRQR